MRVARRIGAIPVLAVMWFLLALLGAPGADAHSALLSSDPADGATVATLPSAATLTFSEDVNGDFTQIVAQGSGEPRTVTASVAGPVVTAPLPADLGTGKVAVRYRVVSKDGHPISGEIGFTVGSGATASSGANSPSGTASPGASSSAAPSASSTTSPRATGTSAVRDGSDNIVAYVLTGVGAVVLLVVGIVIWRWEKKNAGGIGR